MMKSFLKNRISFNLVSISSNVYAILFIIDLIYNANVFNFEFAKDDLYYLLLFVFSDALHFMAIPTILYLCALLISMIVLIAESFFGFKIENKFITENVFYGILFYTGLSLSVVIILFLLHLAFVVYF